MCLSVPFLFRESHSQAGSTNIHPSEPLSQWVMQRSMDDFELPTASKSNGQMFQYEMASLCGAVDCSISLQEEVLPIYWYFQHTSIGLVNCSILYNYPSKFLLYWKSLKNWRGESLIAQVQNTQGLKSYCSLFRMKMQQKLFKEILTSMQLKLGHLIRCNIER